MSTEVSITISPLSIAELEFVLAIKTRTREIHEQALLIEGLCTLDALQLAIALDLRQLGHMEVLVAADQRLCRIASLSGCSAVNPERPDPVLA